MPSAFLTDASGPFVVADPNSDLDYSIATWLDGLTFSLAVWSITPVGPVLHDPSINAAPVTIDGKTFAIGELATTWVNGLVAGVAYTMTLRATFTGNRIDERSFRIVVKDL